VWILGRAFQAQQPPRQLVELMKTADIAPPAAGLLGRDAEYTPGRLIDCATMDMPVTVTPSQISRWPTKPTPPPITQWRPMMVLPEIPTQAAIAV
jgi:hypothetical protein